jgi:hypothetical protein
MIAAKANATMKDNAILKTSVNSLICHVELGRKSLEKSSAIKAR